MFTSALARRVRHLLNQWRADRLERAVCRELLNMGPRLLDDIGLSLNDVTAAMEQRRRHMRHADRLAAIEALRQKETTDGAGSRA
ncbi:MAG TPA: hypothetical protein PK286_00345 [Devosia sp.]|nr:hypothetical protein [Devosia sp.]